jgi:hypothetical protein
MVHPASKVCFQHPVFLMKAQWFEHINAYGNIPRSGHHSTHLLSDQDRQRLLYKDLPLLLK